MSEDGARWQRLQDLVQAALDRPADERAAFLATACGGDEELRREADSLVERDHRADDFLAAPIGALAANAITYSPGTALENEGRDLIGSRIGAYEILTRIGAGGMGEVYRARDHSLHRDVAIKVLPAEFLHDQERLARFEREARLLASLNHPHIGAVYGLEGSGDLRGIVLELIDGETLETRLTRGPIPVTQALTLAVQIAGALDHAHQHGVMHRDLKPANIMLVRRGGPSGPPESKLLDFGLAKWGDQRRGYVSTSGASAARPEGVESVTSEGTILGTLHYMAPEQLEGKKVDARADVFAFGAVLYEMLIGTRAFDGGSTAAVMAAVLNTQPAGLDSVQQLASPALERIVRKCLAKNPDDRWQTTRDLADELSWVASQTTTAAAPSHPALSSRRGSGRLTIVAVAIATVLAGGTGWFVAQRGVSPLPRAITSFALLPSTGGINAFNISHDGALLAYINGPQRSVFVRRLDQFTDVPIAGTEGANSPFFSSDGNWVAYTAGSRMMKVKVDGTAAPISICETSIVDGLIGATWLTDGTIIFGTMEHGLRRVSAEGGEPAPLTKLSETPKELDYHHPTLLPGGRVVLFTLHDADERFKIAVENLDSSERKIIIEGAYDPQFLPSGHLVFGKDNAVWAVSFDLQRLEVTGPPVSLVESVAGIPSNGTGGFRLSANGTLVFRPMPNLNGRALTWVNRSGTEEPLEITPRAFSSPSVSPDGSKVAFANTEVGRRDIWTYELSTERLTRLTREGDNRAPVWTRDGLRLTYASMFGNPPRLLWQLADGSAPSEVLITGGDELVAGAWSYANRELFYTDAGTGKLATQLFVLSKGELTPRRIDAKDTRRHPALSPDGRWLAYTSMETGSPEVFVSDLPAMSTRYQVTAEGGGREPKWSRDGREIVYRSFGRVFGVRIDTTRGFSAGKPQVLFDRNYVVGGFDTMGLDYDLAPDGRLLMIKPGTEEQAPAGVRVTLNWMDELARRVPTGQ